MGSAGQPVALPDLYMARLGVPRRIEVSVESFLLAPFLLQGTDLVTLWRLNDLPPPGPADPLATACVVVGPPPIEAEWERMAPGIPYHRICTN